MPYAIVAGHASRSFPTGDPFLAGASPLAQAECVVYLGGARAHADPGRQVILVELGNECLGFHTGEAMGHDARLGCYAGVGAVQMTYEIVSYVYVGRYECGCNLSVVVDDPKEKQHTAETVAQMIAKGASVSRMTAEEFRNAGFGHRADCPKKQKKAEQGSLL